MKKRVLSIVMALVLCLGLAIPALASNSAPAYPSDDPHPGIALAAGTTETTDKHGYRYEFSYPVIKSEIMTFEYDEETLTVPVNLVPMGTLVFRYNPDGTIAERGMLSLGEADNPYTFENDNIWEVGGFGTGLFFRAVDAEDGTAGDNDTPATPTTPAAPAVNFSDVKDTAFYAEPVAWAVENGITNGTSETTFSPDATCTQAQILTFLWRACGSPEPTIDPMDYEYMGLEESTFYYKAALWAVEEMLIFGYFDFSAPCTRQDVVLYLWILAGNPDVPGTLPFTDVPGGMALYAAVSWALSEGITNGVSDTSFAPDATCTRAQIVTFLYRAFAD